jgi:hypothetical protein
MLSPVGEKMLICGRLSDGVAMDGGGEAELKLVMESKIKLMLELE